MRGDLWEAYRSTRFEAATPMGKIGIRVGKVHAELDSLLEGSGNRSWCFVTAWNPGSRVLATEENDERNRSLLVEIESAARWRPVFEGMGWPDDGKWEPERSFLVLGVERAEAIELGRRHGQNAVVWGAFAEAAELLDCQAADAVA